MLQSSRRRGGRIAAPVVVFCTIAAAHAAPITYTVSGVTSGSLGTKNFVDAEITLTAVADTGAVRPLAPGVACNDLGQATFTIDGIASGSITTPVSIADNAGWQLLAITRGRCADGGLMWTNGRHPSFANYGLASAMSPVALEMPGAPPGVSVATPGGDLVLRNLSTLAFRAELNPLPAQLQQPVVLAGPTSVPTLSGGALGALCALVAGSGAFFVRRRRSA